MGFKKLSENVQLAAVLLVAAAIGNDVADTKSEVNSNKVDTHTFKHAWNSVQLVASLGLMSVYEFGRATVAEIRDLF